MMKYFILTLALLSVFCVAEPALAQSAGSCPPGTSAGSCPPPVTGKATLENPFKGTGNSLVTLFYIIIDQIIFPLGGVIAVLAFIWAGFMFVTARGDEGKIKTARTALLYAAIGTAILLGSKAIVLVLENTLKSLK